MHLTVDLTKYLSTTLDNNNESEYSKFLDSMNILKFSFLERYGYLALKEETWDSLFDKAITKNLSDITSSVVDASIAALINKNIRNYINRQIKENKPRILNNLLIYLSREVKSYPMLLNRFFRYLEVEDIKINEEYFSALKDYSKILKKILNSLGVYDLSLKELKAFLTKEPDFYDLINITGLSYKDKIARIDYILNLMPDGNIIRRQIKSKQVSDDTRKFKLIVENYSSILKIHELIREEVGSFKSVDVDKTIISYRIEKIKQLLDDYHSYKSSKRDKTFLYLLMYNAGIKRIKPQNKPPISFTTFKEDKQEQAIGQVSKPAINNSELASKPQSEEPKKATTPLSPKNIGGRVPSDSYKLSNELNVNNSSAENQIPKEFYNLFKKPKTLNLTKYQEIINDLWVKLSISQKELLLKFISNKDISDTEYDEALKIVQGLNKEYKDKVKHYKEIPQTKASIYEYFPLQDDINEEERKRIVDKLLSARSSKEKEIIATYLKGKSDSLYDIYSNFKILIDSMRQIYRRKGKSILEVKKAKTLPDYFPLAEGILEEEKIKIVDILYNELNDEEKSLVNSFINKEFDSKDERHKKALNIINNMRRKYNKYGKRILTGEINNKPKRQSIYDYFPLLENMTEEEHKQIIDILLSRKNEETRNLIKSFFNNEFDNKDERRKNVINILSRMKKIYNDNGKEILNWNASDKGYRKTNIYEYIKKSDDITEEEHRQIVDILVGKRNKEHQQMLSDYFAGLIKTSDIRYRRVGSCLINIQRIYNKYGKALLTINLKDKRKRSDIYSYFSKKDDITKEEHKQVVDILLNRLTEEQRSIVVGYINSEFDYKDKKYKIFRTIISHMQNSYNTKGKNILTEKIEPPKTTIYDYFPLAEGILEEEKIKIVDILYSELIDEEKSLVNSFINKEFDSKDDRHKKALNIINNMRRKYNKYGKRILTGEINNEPKRQSIYDYFPLLEDITDEEHKQIIDILLSRKNEETRNLIKSFFNNEFDNKDERRKKAIAALSRMKKIYNDNGKEILNWNASDKGDRKTNIYEYIKKLDGITEEEHKRIIDILLSRKDEETRNLIKSFFNNEFDNKDERRKKATDALNKMRKTYNGNGKKILGWTATSLGKRKASIYEYIKKSADITEEEHRQIVDILVGRRNKEHQQMLSDYFAGLIKSNDSRYIKVGSCLLAMQRTYNNHGKSLLTIKIKDKRKRSDIYSYFSKKDDITEEEHQKIIDILLNRLTEEKRSIVVGYINNEFDYKDKKYKIFRTIISHMQNSYNTKGKNILTEKIEPPITTIYDYFPLLGDITDEERKEIVDILLNDLEEDRKSLIDSYLKKEYDSTDKRYKTFSYTIKTMRNMYNKYGKKILTDKITIRSKKKKDIYGYFPIPDGMSKEEHQQIVDILFNNLKPEIRDLINAYIKGEFNSRDARFNQIRGRISWMQQQYKNKLQELLNLEVDKKFNIYDYFPLEKGMTDETRNQIVDILLNERHDLEKELINSYINGEFDNKDERYKKVVLILVAMRKKYRQEGLKVLKPKQKSKLKKTSIYDYFPNIEGITEEEKIKIVDILLSDKSEDDRNLIDAYVKGEFNSRDKRYKRFNSLINTMVYAYRNNGKSLLEPPSPINIYDYFPLTSSMVQSERKRIVDTLLNIRNKQDQHLITDFIDGTIRNTSPKYNVVQDLLKEIQNQYNKLIEDKEKEVSAIKNYFGAIINLIYTKYGITIPSLSYSKMLVLYDALRVNEYIYRGNGYSKSQYSAYLDNRLIEIFKVDMDLETLIITFIESEFKTRFTRERKV